MPATITQSPIDVERKDPGSGGRPPVPRRPTGGGGGDENWGRGQPRRGPRELLTRCRMGLGFALAGDLTFFVSLILAFYAQQHTGHVRIDDPYILDWKPLTVPPILWINTAILVLSGWTMEMARRSVFRELDVMEEWLGLGRPTSRRALPWLAATLVLGCLFIAGQLVAWRQLYGEGVYFASNPNSHFFYLVTGAHTLHLLLGAAALVVAVAALGSSRRMEIRQIVVDMAAWYWHVMGALWLLLFGLLLLAQ
ncbi:MAG: cytochrome c oxidase subunit 3 [Acidobacteriaceae bacterium]